MTKESAIEIYSFYQERIELIPLITAIKGLEREGQ